MKTGSTMLVVLITGAMLSTPGIVAGGEARSHDGLLDPVEAAIALAKRQN